MKFSKEIAGICKQFDIDGKYRGCDIIPYGHINSTFQAFYEVDNKIRIYIIQKINKYVFTKPYEVMENIYNVTRHIINKANERGENSKTVSLHFKKTKDGELFYVDENNEYWRCYRFVENSYTTYDVPDKNILLETGKAFGKFQKELRDFDASTLHETIKKFHDTTYRYEQLEQAIKENKKSRLEICEEEVEKFRELKEKATMMHYMLQNGELPLRVTHNDTKCNNVLFDESTNKYLTVIDLDTVMPGLVAYDFGDAIRFAANTALEDEDDLAKVRLDLIKYEAFTKGFLSELKDSLTQKEIETLYLGAITMTIECGVRFLTDYLNGDEYFRIEKANHNLLRARCQLKLALDMLRKEKQMIEIVKKYS